ncbi:MAG: AAA family ATPase, partial [Flavipsychrobacter sp.]
MRITKVNIPATEIPICGLEDIAMDKLGKVVLLAGKNGAGKSRLLNKIFSKLPQKPGKSAVINARNRLDNYKDGINGIESRISELEKQISIGFTPAVLKQNIENKIKSDADLNEKIKDAESILEWKFIETDELVESYIAVNFVPRHLMLTDPVTLMKSQIGSYANSLSVTSMDNIHNGALPKIQAVQDRWFNATHPGSDIGDAEKSQAISDYNKLCEVIKNFLNTTISRTIEGDATLFGFPLGQAQLSNGQKILIQFCLAIYSQEIALKDLIIFLDEPENHLHPSAIIETIELISKNVSNGQI